MGNGVSATNTMVVSQMSVLGVRIIAIGWYGSVMVTVSVITQPLASVMVMVYNVPEPNAVVSQIVESVKAVNCGGMVLHWYVYAGVPPKANACIHASQA